jgi:hypothetical protein
MIRNIKELSPEKFRYIEDNTKYIYTLCTLVKSGGGGGPTDQYLDCSVSIKA